jgi:hypothetical protein
VDWLGAWQGEWPLNRSRKSANADRIDDVRGGIYWFTLVAITACTSILCRNEISA